MYTHHYTRLNYRTAIMQYHACHQTTSIQVIQFNDWTVTVIIQLRLPPVLLMTPRIPPPAQRRDADGRGGWTQISAVRRLRWRLLDRSKNAIFTYSPAFGAPPPGSDPIGIS